MGIYIRYVRTCQPLGPSSSVKSLVHSWLLVQVPTRRSTDSFAKMSPLPRGGKRLELIQTLLIALPSFVLFGYNQSGLGGLLSIESWVETFPEIDTIHTKGAQKSTNSTVQVS